jgi:hypothetical protein
MYFQIYQYEELSSTRFRNEFSDGPMKVLPPTYPNIQAAPSLPKVGMFVLDRL